MEDTFLFRASDLRNWKDDPNRSALIDYALTVHELASDYEELANTTIDTNVLRGFSFWIAVQISRGELVELTDANIDWHERNWNTKTVHTVRQGLTS